MSLRQNAVKKEELKKEIKDQEKPAEDKLVSARS